VAMRRYFYRYKESFYQKTGLHNFARIKSLNQIIMAFTIRLNKAQEENLSLFMHKLSVKTKQEAFQKMLKICLELILENKNSSNLSQERSPSIFCICKNTEAAESAKKTRIKK